MKRDEHCIIMQPDGIEVEIDGVKTAVDDGGDSAFSTGMSAYGGSDLDFNLMPLFIKDGLLVRHPFQNYNTGTAPHNDPKATSRDQVLGFFAGLLGRKLGPEHEKVREACLAYANGWRVNGDVLGPAAKFYLFRCAGAPVPWWLWALAYAHKGGELGWDCWIKPGDEMNKAVPMCEAYGKRWVWLLYKCHPDLFKNLREYFGGWRQREPIAEGVIRRASTVVAGG